mgnify:CR=1 FL=1
MSNFKTTILQVSIHREDSNPVFGEGNTYIAVRDEAAGPFLSITQTDDYSENGTIRCDFEELKAIMAASEMLMHQMYIEKAEMESK